MRDFRSYLASAISAIGLLLFGGAFIIVALIQFLSYVSLIKNVQEAPGDLGIALRFFFGLNMWAVGAVAGIALVLHFRLVFEQSAALAKANDGLLEFRECRAILESTVKQQERLYSLADELKANSDADFKLKSNQIGTSFGVVRAVLAFERVANPVRVLAVALKAEENTQPLIGWHNWPNLYLDYTQKFIEFERVASIILGGLDQAICASPNTVGLLALQMQNWDIPAERRQDYIMFERSLRRLSSAESAINSWSKAVWPQDFQDHLVNPNDTSLN